MRRFESYLPSDLRVFARGILRMKSAVFGLPQILAGFAGLGLAAKVVAGIFVIATAAGGAFYAFSQKTYAPKTIHFDGRDFYLVLETKFSAALEGAEKYGAVYSTATEAEREADEEWQLNNLRLDYYVLYSANPAPEWMQDGVLSPAAYKADIKRRHGPNPNPKQLLHEEREKGGESFSATVIDTPQPDAFRLLVHATRCGASRKNAHVCIAYILRANPEKYPSPQEWADAEGAAELERIYDLLANYPLSHNEELLADMAAAK